MYGFILTSPFVVCNRKERQLKAEIGDLQQRINEAEGRTEELSNAVSAATRPLLRQMESLQATHSNQRSSWESLELNLSKRLSNYFYLNDLPYMI